MEDDQNARLQKQKTTKNYTHMNCFGPESFKLGGGGHIVTAQPRQAKLQFIVTAHPSSSLARLLPQPSQAKLQLWKKLLSSFSEFWNFFSR